GRAGPPPVAPPASRRPARTHDPLRPGPGLVAHQPAPVAQLALCLVLLGQPVARVAAVQRRLDPAGPRQRPAPEAQVAGEERALLRIEIERLVAVVDQTDRRLRPSGHLLIRRER